MRPRPKVKKESVDIIMKLDQKSKVKERRFVCVRVTPCPEQCATREVVLEREDPGALLLMVTRHISRIRLLCQLASRRTDSAVRHHDSQSYSKTARAPLAYTVPLSRSGM